MSMKRIDNSQIKKSQSILVTRSGSDWHEMYVGVVIDILHDSDGITDCLQLNNDILNIVELVDSTYSHERLSMEGDCMVNLDSWAGIRCFELTEDEGYNHILLEMI